MVYPTTATNVKVIKLNSLHKYRPNNISEDHGIMSPVKVKSKHLANLQITGLYRSDYPAFLWTATPMFSALIFQCSFSSLRMSRHYQVKVCFLWKVSESLQPLIHSFPVADFYMRTPALYSLIKLIYFLECHWCRVLPFWKELHLIAQRMCWDANNAIVTGIL